MLFSTLLFALFSSAGVCFGQKQYPCIHPGGGAGNCISFHDCPLVLDVAKKDTWLQEEMEFLTKVQCGYKEKRPTVCCPKTCSTTSGQPGVCLTKYSCPSFNSTNMGDSATNSDEGLRAGCEGSKEENICCGESSDIRISDLIGIHHKCEYQETVLPPDGWINCCGVGRPGENYGLAYEDATAIGQYPWMALIEYQRLTGGVVILCGGALISAQFVLTAAHCLVGPIREYSEPKLVRLGEYLQSHEGPDCVTFNGKTDCTSGAVRVAINRYEVHPEFNQTNRVPDIGIVQMLKVVTFNEFIRPICLSNSPIDLAANVKVTIVGWGQVMPSYAASVYSRHIELPIIEFQKCQQTYETMTSGQLCAGDETGKYLCGGESAMPIFLKRGNRFELFGIESLAPSPCGLSGNPVLLAQVYMYRSWIDSTIYKLSNL